MFRPTDIDSLYLEANMLDIMKTVDDKVMAGIERHRRRPDGDPLRVKALGTTPRVRKDKVYHNECWQQCADNIQERYKVYTRRRLIDKVTGDLKTATDYNRFAVTAAEADIAFIHRAPLDDPSNTIRPDAAKDVTVRFYTQLITPVNASTSDADKLRSALETIERLRRNVRGAIWELWTDGAVARRTGAGAAQLYIGRDEQPKWTECAPAGNCTDSFATESLAVKTGLDRIARMRRPGVNNQVIVVYTDCQGLITALQSGPIRQRDAQMAAIWRSVYSIYNNGAKRISFQWIPAHCGVPRNVRVDATARQALAQFGSMTQRKVPVRYQNLVSYYKEKGKAHYLSALQQLHPFRASITTAPANLKSDNALGRRNQVKLAQLRSGVCNTMGFYQRLAADHFRPNYNRRCRWCGIQDETVGHVYNECEDLQLVALRDELRVATGRQITTECLDRDLDTALLFHDRALGYLRH
jgi:ribonuclease HI